MALGLPETMIRDATEAFKMMSHDGPTVPISELGDLLRMAGQNPTEAQVIDLCDQIDGSTLTLDIYLECLARPGGTTIVDPKQFEAAFKAFDKGADGKVSTADLKYILTNIGEKMSEVEVDEVLKHLNGPEIPSEIKYMKLVEMLISQPNMTVL